MIAPTRGRIVSLLPSATEMVYALGLGDQLVAVSHECDHPEDARTKPSLVRPALELDGLGPGAIDAAVSARLREGRSLYAIDEALLARLAPDLVLTQDLCQVCAPSGDELSAAIGRLAERPRVLSMSPRTLAGVRDNLRDLAAATGRTDAADAVAAEWDARIAAVAARAATLPRRPRVFVMEWLDPIYCAGHWTPEMVRLAGGADVLGREGADSVRLAWDEARAAEPDVLILSPCGYGLEAARAQVPLLARYDGLRDWPAAREGRVYVVDANSYFARPGPRLIDGLELLSHLIAGAPWRGPADAYARIDAAALTP